MYASISHWAKTGYFPMSEDELNQALLWLKCYQVDRLFERSVNNSCLESLTKLLELFPNHRHAIYDESGERWTKTRHMKKFRGYHVNLTKHKKIMPLLVQHELVVSFAHDEPITDFAMMKGLAKKNISYFLNNVPSNPEHRREYYENLRSIVETFPNTPHFVDILKYIDSMKSI